MKGEAPYKRMCRATKLIEYLKVEVEQVGRL